MKKVIVFALLTLPSFLFGQYQDGFLKETFFARQPGARAESLGKAYCSVDGDLTTVFYNPAGTATLQGIGLHTSLSTPYYMVEKSRLIYTAAGFNINKYLTVGISWNHYFFGEEINFTDSLGNPSVTGIIPTTSVYTLNFSSQPVKNLFIGLNTSYLIWKPTDKSAHSLFFDFGIIKKFEFGKTPVASHSINVGTSIKNLNFSTVKPHLGDSLFTGDLPVITRVGMNYQFTLNKHWIFKNLNSFRLFVQTDYQFLLNSKYEKGFYNGLELTFCDILSLRSGIYTESHYDENASSGNEYLTGSLTYGLGLQIPLDKLTNIPLRVNFDYTRLPESPYSQSLPYGGKFSTYTLKINWIMNE